VVPPRPDQSKTRVGGFIQVDRRNATRSVAASSGGAGQFKKTTGNTVRRRRRCRHERRRMGGPDWGLNAND